MSKRRVLVVVGLLAGVGVLGAAAAPWLASGSVLKKVEEEANKNLHGSLTFSGGGLQVWRSFPNATVFLEEVHLEGADDFAGVPLFDAQRVEVTVDLMSALGSGPIRVLGLNLEQPQVNLLVNDAGLANYEDILPPEDPAAAPAEDAASTEVWLRDLAISGLNLTYEDRPGDLSAQVTGLDLTGDAEVEADVLAMRTKAEIAGLSATQGGVRLLKEVATKGVLDVRYTPASGAVHFGDSTLSLNALQLAFSGDVAPEEAGTRLDLSFASSQATFKSLLSLIPAAYTPDFGKVDADGTFTLKGSVKGLLPSEGDDLPAFDLDLDVGKGRFAYPGLPSKVDGIELAAHVTHPGGDADRVEVDMSRFALTVDGQTVRGRLAVKTPVSDPWVDLEAKGALDVGKLTTAFPQDGFTATGRMALDVQVLGKASDFEASRVDNVTAKGLVTLTDVVYTDPTQPVAFHIEDLELGLDPRNLDLTRFKVTFGKSDINANGRIGNTLGWIFADQTLTGEFTVKGSYVDSRPFESTDEEAAAADAEVYVFPSNLDLKLDVAFKKVDTQDYELTDVRGRATLQNGELHLYQLRADTLGGSIGIDGTYLARTPKQAEVDMDISVESAEIPAVVATFTSIQTMVPLMREAKGKVGTSMKLQTKLGPDYSPDLMTLFSTGTFNTNGAVLSPAFLAPVAAFAGNNAMKTLALDNKTSSFTIDGGKLDLKEIPVKVGAASGSLHGKTGVADSSLDLILDLAMPAGSMGPASEAFSKLGAAGADLGLRAEITGTWDKPKVKVGLNQSLTDVAKGLLEDKVGALVDDARAKLIAEATAQGDKLVAEAESAAKKLRDEAGKQADKVRDEAKKQGDKLIKDAKGNSLKEAAAKKAAEALKKEADKAAKKIESTADKQADKVVGEAKTQRTTLISKASAG